MLAYCTANGSSRGHLVYVASDHPPVTHVIRTSGTEIACHAVDLDQSPQNVLGRVRVLADEIVRSAPTM